MGYSRITLGERWFPREKEVPMVAQMAQAYPVAGLLLLVGVVLMVAALLGSLSKDR